MNGLKEKIKDVINGDSKTRLIVTSIFSVVLVSVLLLGSTYSLFITSSVDEDLNVYKTGNLDITYTLSSDNIKLNDSTPTSVYDSVYIEPYRITISNSGNVPYMFNIILDDSTATDVISYEYIMTQVGRTDAVRLADCTDNVIREDVIVPAGESVSVDVRIFLADDIKNTELGKSFYAKLSVDGIAVYNESTDIDNSILIADVLYKINEPELDDGLIPVYYDEEMEVWKKAGSNNEDNSWYNYDEKKWANAVLIKDVNKREKYIEADVGTKVVDEDITAFFVWIPRFKYRVWNIARQSGDEETYSYKAYTDGIEVKWEKDVKSTGNVSCAYDVNAIEAEANLSDVCVYNDEEVTTASVITDYTDAWYTHPAFTYEKEKTGFWIGKFETTEKDEESFILPDSYSWLDLTDKDVSDIYDISNEFLSYGLNGLESYNINNLEWGAVTYLTHSIYGICDDEGCSNVYNNNSYYTGMSSGGVTSDGEVLYGNYNYKGYNVDSLTGDVTDDKDISKIASTTGNITGVYDFNGGSSELVLGKLKENDELDTELLYSYGLNSSDKKAYNRTRLGDATAEFSGIEEIEGAVVSADDGLYWLRGGNINSSTIFDFNAYTGVWTEDIGGITGRTVLK